ncbi:hypothetical protein ILUMI_26019 [Ignelater luminosus]|uniref:Nipped-B protein n=1 Tax=Ignelater luminosus TaxID=2038154 RepID=A0A8K0FZ33_IGNLU|nr:hypothetical protein ILUMI_26019 [Ignelater luminosus]
MIIETDISLLTKHEVQTGINHTFLDLSASVREVTAELIGKFILKQPELIDNFYDTLSARILDTSVSVRKRIIRFFYDLCITFSDFPKKTDIYMKIMRRINDEESVQRLVMEVFLNIWFTPCNNKSVLLQKVTSIINTVGSCDELNLDSFQKLVCSLCKSQMNKTGSEIKEGTENSLFLAFKQLIQHLVKNLPKCNANVITSLRILLIFSQIEPQLIVEYARILQPYLNSNHNTKITSITAQIFKQIVPVIPQKKLPFLYELEEDLMKLILKHDHVVVANNEDIQLNTVKAIGSLCLRHNEFLLNSALKEFYHCALISEEISFSIKLSVLKNIEMYIVEVNNINVATHGSKVLTEEDLKRIEVSSGVATSTIQYYVKDILQSYLHSNFQIRQVTVRLIQMILQQGVTHPVQIVPYLICMSSDTETVVSNSADKQLLEINRTYPGYIKAKSSLGLKLSYQLQKRLHSIGMIRGFKINSTNEHPLAMNGFLYSLLRGFKQQRRSFILNILKQFDEDDMNFSLSYLLYLADNLAYFIYTTQEELLFLIHHIDRIVAYSGGCILKSFKQGLKTEDQEISNYSTTSEASFIDKEDENETVLLEQLPDNISSLQRCLTASQRFLLLLLLKQYLKQIYGVTDYKSQQYCPMDSTKLYEKPINRRKHLKFDPKPIINQLEQESLLRSSDANERKRLVHQYLYFKQLMLEYDSTDPDTETNENRSTSDCLTTNHISQPSELKRKQSRDSGQQKVKINKRRRKRQKFSYSCNEDYDTEEFDSE